MIRCIAIHARFKDFFPVFHRKIIKAESMYLFFPLIFLAISKNISLGKKYSGIFDQSMVVGFMDRIFIERVGFVFDTKPCLKVILRLFSLTISFSMSIFFII